MVSRVSTGHPRSAAWAPIIKSDSSPERVPPRRLYSARAACQVQGSTTRFAQFQLRLSHEGFERLDRIEAAGDLGVDDAVDDKRPAPAPGVDLRDGPIGPARVPTSYVNQ